MKLTAPAFLPAVPVIAVPPELVTAPFKVRTPVALVVIVPPLPLLPPVVFKVPKVRFPAVLVTEIAPAAPLAPVPVALPFLAVKLPALLLSVMEPPLPPF